MHGNLVMNVKPEALKTMIEKAISQVRRCDYKTEQSFAIHCEADLEVHVVVTKDGSDFFGIEPQQYRNSDK